MPIIKVLNSFKSRDLSRPDILFGISKAINRWFSLDPDILYGLTSHANAERILAARGDVLFGLPLKIWTSYLDEAKWTPTFGIWDGDSWESELNGVYQDVDLVPAGGWEVDFKPEFLQVIHDYPDQLAVQLYFGDAPLKSIVTTGSPIELDLSGQKEKLSDATFDIYSIKSSAVKRFIGFTNQMADYFSVEVDENTIAIGENREILTGSRQDKDVNKYDSAGLLLDTLVMARHIWGVAWDGTNLFTMESTSGNSSPPNLFIVRYTGWSNSISLSLDIGAVFTFPRSMSINPINGNVVISGNNAAEYWAAGNNEIREYLGFSASLVQSIDYSAVEPVAKSCGVAFTPTGDLIVSAYADTNRCIIYDGMDTSKELSAMTGKWVGEEEYLGAPSIAVGPVLDPVYPWNFDISRLWIAYADVSFNVTGIDFGNDENAPRFISSNLASIFLVHAPDSDNDSRAVALDRSFTPLSESNFVDEGLSYSNRSAMMSDGRVVISGYDGSEPVKVNCYMTGSTTELSWTHTINGSAHGYYSDVCVLTNGNIVCLWGDYNDDNEYFVILSPAGELVQDITSADPEDNYEANDDEPCHVIALDDGGFYCYWMCDGTYPCGSVWNGDGTIRTDYYYYNGDIERSAPVQMPSGGGGTYAGWLVIPQSYYNAIAMLNPDDMGDFTNVAEGEMSNPAWIFMATPPTWTDRIAVLWAEGTTTYYMIVDDEGDTTGWSTLISNIIINDLILLPDGNLLMPYHDGASEYGQSFYILDTSDNTKLTILSGPHTVFTGLSTDTDPCAHGCAGYPVPVPFVGTTFDPVNKGSKTIISGDDLVAACGDGTAGPQSAARSIGTIAEGSKTIFEFTHTADTWEPEEEARCRMGFGTADATLDLGVGSDGSTSLGLQNDGGISYNGGDVPGGSFGWGWIVGDTITFEVERSGGDAIVTFYKNGVDVGTRTLAMPAGPWHAMVSNALFLFTSTITANFSGPFQIEPTAGFSPIPV